MAENGRWAEYKEYSNKKKLPLEPSAFVEVALDHAAPTSIISTLVERVQDNAERAKFYLKMGCVLFEYSMTWLVLYLRMRITVLQRREN